MITVTGEAYILSKISQKYHDVQRIFLRRLISLEKGINIFRSDTALFVNKEIEELTRRYGITNQRTIPFTPEQNGSTEWENRTVVDLARMSLHAEKLPIKMWVEAINYTVYTLDKTETSGKKGITIIEL